MPHTIDPFTDPAHPLHYADIKTRWLHRTYTSIINAVNLPEQFWHCVRVARGDFAAMDGVLIDNNVRLNPIIQEHRIIRTAAMVNGYCRYFIDVCEKQSLHAASADALERKARGESTDMIPPLAMALRATVILLQWRQSAGFGVDAEGATIRLCRTLQNFLKLSELQHLSTPIPALTLTPSYERAV